MCYKDVKDLLGAGLYFFSSINRIIRALIFDAHIIMGKLTALIVAFAGIREASKMFGCCFNCSDGLSLTAARPAELTDGDQSQGCHPVGTASGFC